MKTRLYLTSILAAVVSMVSCSEQNKLHETIDDLNTRLDALTLQMKGINSDLSSCTELVKGTITILGYTRNEYGDYEVRLSNGKSVKVYSGEMEEEIPHFAIGENGWYYTVGGESHPLLAPDGNPAPVSGLTPQVRINERGYWEYSFDGTVWMDGFGSGLPGTGSIFDDVVAAEDGSSLTFKWHVGDDEFSKEIKLYGGLDLTIDFGAEATPIVFTAGNARTFPVVQTNVEKIVIENTVWGVKITDTDITMTPPSVADKTTIVVKIFSREGWCKPVMIPVQAN